MLGNIPRLSDDIREVNKDSYNAARFVLKTTFSATLNWT